MQNVSNPIISVLVVALLTGCYTTTPKSWTSHQVREVVDSKISTPNGSRLEIQGKINGNEIRMISAEIPQCRLVDVTHPVMKERGQKEEHSWPVGLVGLGAMLGGAAMIADGQSRESEAEEDVRLGETIGGVTISLIGLMMGGLCGLGNCNSDIEFVEREVDGAQFKRWNGEPKRDCSGATARISPNIPIILSTTWEKHKSSIKWNPVITDGQGTVSMLIADSIRLVAAHCGNAKTTIRADTLGGLVLEDTPSNPSKHRDDSGVFAFNIAPPKTVASPHAISDPLLRNIAEECATRNQMECAGTRSDSIKNKCETDCNSQGGGAYCEEQRNLEIGMPGISDTEKEEITKRYSTCVKEHKVDTSASTSCASACIEKALNTICPNPW